MDKWILLYFCCHLYIGFSLSCHYALLFRYRYQGAQPVNPKKGSWLLYSLPMIALWVFSLLIFFPGIMSLDPIIQWQQVLHGQYADQHPLLYTLLIALVSKVYYSPASVVVAQILMISLAFAWGLAELQRMGVSRKSSGFGDPLRDTPVNILSAIALRKDVLYSAAILVLSINVLKGDQLQGRMAENRLELAWAWGVPGGDQPHPH